MSRFLMPPRSIDLPACCRLALRARRRRGLSPGRPAPAEALEGRVLLAADPALAAAALPDHAVRVAYLIPSDRTPQPDGVAKLQNRVRIFQDFFADQMQRNGFGRKTFHYETETDGLTPKVHVVSLPQSAATYRVDPFSRTRADAQSARPDLNFFGSNTVWLIVYEGHALQQDGTLLGDFFGGASNTAGSSNGSDGGTGLVGSDVLALMHPKYLSDDRFYEGVTLPELGDAPLTADSFQPFFAGTTVSSLASARIGATLHEMVHGFGVGHDFRNDENFRGNLMGHGHRGFRGYVFPDAYPDDSTRLGYSTALVLNSSRYFNAGPFTDNTLPQFTTPLAITPTPANGSLRISITASDAGGLASAVLQGDANPFDGIDTDADAFDQVSLTGTSASVTFNTPYYVPGRTNRFTVFAYDRQGNRTRVTATVVPNATANRAPVASLRVNPEIVAAGETVTLDASPSSDPDHPLSDLRVEWDLDNDGVFDTARSTSKVLTTSFSTPGSRVIRLRVTDPLGARSVSQPLGVRVLPVFRVTNTNNSGTGSLRQAIVNANNAVGGAVVRFAIPTTDPNFVDVDGFLNDQFPNADDDPDAARIRPLSPLPALNNSTGGILIDGTSQTAFVGNLNDFGPEVVLDGSLAGAAANGLDLRSAYNEVRGLAVGNFTDSGVLLGGRNHTVADNYLGTDATGFLARPNLRGVLVVNSSANNIRGARPENRNVISGNTRAGVAIRGASSNLNLVQGNFIGTNSAGTRALPNGSDGVQLQASRYNVVGGTSPGAGNVIAGNRASGVAVFAGAADNEVQANLIGTNGTGAAIPNGGRGVEIVDNSVRNLIGGAADGAGNGIAFNKGDGVYVAAGTGIPAGNSVLGNSIYANTGLGIDLVGGTENPAGVTANDAGDGDAGPNNLQNYPVLSGASTAGGGTIVTGTLNSRADTNHRVEFFWSPPEDADPSGFGEGRFFLGSTTVTTGGSSAGFRFVSPTAIPLGSRVTATATGAGGNTSEFSRPVTATTVAPWVQSFTLVDAGNEQDVMTIEDGDVIALAALPTRNLNIRANPGPGVGSVRFGYDATPGNFNPNFRVESSAPLALFGDVGGNYNAGTLQVGEHTLTGTAFSGANATGTVGLVTTIRFRVV
jgi:hypothetical protein